MESVVVLSVDKASVLLSDFGSIHQGRNFTRATRAMAIIINIITCKNKTDKSQATIRLIGFILYSFLDLFNSFLSSDIKKYKMFFYLLDSFD